MRAALQSSTLVAFALAALPALSAGDAVSGPNGKLSASYGDFDSFEGASYQSSFAVPLAAKWGAQFDGLYNRIGGVDFGGAGAHLFWRDSERALLGLSAAFVDSADATNYQAGVEAEYYFSWLTVGAFAGAGGIRYETFVPFIDTERTDFAGTFYLGFYPLPDLLVRPKLALAHENLSYGVELESALPRQNLSVIAESLHADHGFQQHQVGLRYYFGGKKSLKARHREDDPINAVADTINARGTYGAEYNERLGDYMSNVVLIMPDGSQVRWEAIYGSSTTGYGYGAFDQVVSVFAVPVEIAN